MLSPEVWQFPPPKSGRRARDTTSEKNLSREIHDHNFYHNIFVLCADTKQDIPHQFVDLFEDSTYYKLSDCKLNELLKIGFIEGYILEGSLSCLSIGKDASIENVVAITSQEGLTLMLDTQSYQSLGIQGKQFRRLNGETAYCKKMPSVKQPAKLEDLALSGVADWVAKIGEDLMPSITNVSRGDSAQLSAVVALNVTRLKDLLDFNIPWMLYDKFAEEIFRAISHLLEKTKESMGFRGSMTKFISKMNVAVSLTEVLLTKNLTRLNLDEVPKMMRHIFYVKFSHLKGLRYLNLGSLSGGWKTDDMEPTIILGLKALSDLRDLTINYDCTDNILQAICKSCPKLQSLDVSSSKSITNQSIDYIIKCKELRRVQLYRTGVSIEGFTRILLNCSKMEDLGRCDELGRVLEYINMTDSQAGPFALRKFVSRYATSVHLQLLVQLCPMLCSISIFHNSMLSDLTLLIGLPELTELKLLSCDFFADQIKQVLEVKGCNILHLHLEHVDQLDLNALMYISRFCPCLESLTLYNCVLVQHTSLFTRRVDWAPFYNLERLMCVCEGTEEQMEFLLGNCVNIRFIHLGTACRTTDRLFDKVMEKNPFLFLEELRILQSDDLTMATISRLLSSCGQLRVLTELECWSSITENDMEYIRNYIKINNLDLDISPLRRYAT